MYEAASLSKLQGTLAVNRSLSEYKVIETEVLIKKNKKQITFVFTKGTWG